MRQSMNQRLFLVLHWFAALMVGVAVLTVTVRAEGKSPGAFTFNAPSQTVVTGADTGVFAASVMVCEDACADGFVSLRLTDGTNLDLAPVAGQLIFAEGPTEPSAALVLLPADLNRPAEPSDFFRATVAPSPAKTDHDLWDFVGSTIEAGPATVRLQFDAQGFTAPTKEKCRPANIGLPLTAANYAPRQKVQPLNGGDPLEFEAQVLIDTSNRRFGFIDTSWDNYDMFTGAALADGEESFRLLMVGVRPQPGVPLTTDDMLQASAALPDVDDINLWEFAGSTIQGDPATVQFEAETWVRVWWDD